MNTYRFIRTDRYWTDCKDANLPELAKVIPFNGQIPPKGCRKLGTRLVELTGERGTVADAVARIRSTSTKCVKEEGQRR